MGSERPQLTTEQVMLIGQVAQRLRSDFPGTRDDDWDLTDPSGQPLEVVREIRDDLRTRVEHLVASLRLDATAADAP